MKNKTAQTKHFYYNFEFNNNETEDDDNMFSDCEEYYFNNEYFIDLINTIPKTYVEYDNIVKEFKNENKSLFIFVLMDLFIKIYNCNKKECENLLMGFVYNNNDTNICVETGYYNILKKILTNIDNYFMYYHYTNDKEKYMFNLSKKILNDVNLKVKFNTFIKQTNENFDLLNNELDSINYIFDYLTKLKYYMEK